MAQEGRHLLCRVQHRVVHIDVDDARAVFNLVGGNLKGTVVVPGSNKPGELPRTGDVGPLAHVGEVVAPVHLYRLKAADVEYGLLFHPFVRCEAADCLGNGCNVLRGGAAAASRDVQQPLRGHTGNLGSHSLRTLVIGAHLVWQAGVRVAAYRAFRPVRKVFNQRGEVFRSQRAVQAETHHPRMLDAAVESLDGLARQGASAAVARRH